MILYLIRKRIYTGHMLPPWHGQTLRYELRIQMGPRKRARDDLFPRNTIHFYMCDTRFECVLKRIDTLKSLKIFIFCQIIRSRLRMRHLAELWSTSSLRPTLLRYNLASFPTHTFPLRSPVGNSSKFSGAANFLSMLSSAPLWENDHETTPTA